jgi:predicted  nucleic acid-binding Zn-ribbon protein
VFPALQEACRANLRFKVSFCAAHVAGNWCAACGMHIIPEEYPNVSSGEMTD